MKRKRKEHVDNRINRTALDLFRLGRGMLGEGFADNSVEFNEVCRGLSRALGLRPWQPDIFDFECSVMDPKSYPPHANFAAVQELHRRLVAAA
jgi:hypothetical protein